MSGLTYARRAALCRWYLPTGEAACSAKLDAATSWLAVLPYPFRTGLLISLVTQWAKKSWAQQARQLNSTGRKYNTPGKKNAHSFSVVTRNTETSITSGISALWNSFRAELSRQHRARLWLLITVSVLHSPGGRVKHQQDLIFCPAAILGLCAGC